MKWLRALALFVAATILPGCGPDADVDARGAGGADFLSVAGALSSGEAEGYARVIGPRELVFPDDHGAHPDHQLEWWYFTGSLEDEQGRPHGFQLTFFRSALSPEAPESESAWATNQSWMAHFTVSDLEAGSFEARERFARGAAGLAGVTTAPFSVWLDDWRIEGLGAEAAIEHGKLVARAEGIALELELKATKPMALQGDRGYSEKGPGEGNASMYYSFTRLDARGKLEIDGRERAVSGFAWMDHEWSTSVLEQGVTGWDWFSLQLDDGRELMLFTLRREEGGISDFSDGTIIERDGSTRRLHREDFGVEVLERWTSPGTGATYPAAWRLKLPSEDLELEVRPLLADQELRVSVAYWEGAVECRGRMGETPLAGRGFVELVGYSDVEAESERSR